MTDPTPAALARTRPWPEGHHRIGWRRHVQQLATDLTPLEPFTKRWQATWADLLFAERQLASLEGRAWPQKSELSRAELAAVEARASLLPVEQADRLTDRAWHSGGIDRLRREGFTSGRHPRNVHPSVDTADLAVDTEVVDS